MTKQLGAYDKITGQKKKNKVIINLYMKIQGDMEIFI